MRGSIEAAGYRCSLEAVAEPELNFADTQSAASRLLRDVTRRLEVERLRTAGPVNIRLLVEGTGFGDGGDVVKLAGPDAAHVVGLGHGEATQAKPGKGPRPRRCVELRPDRFSVFGYAHVPSFKKHQRKIDEAALPDSLERLRQSEAIAGALKQAGYIQIGLDHFALPDDAMAVAFREGRLRRNFQGYTTDESNVLLGFGASAIGRLPQGYVQNEVGTRAYEQAIAADRLATVKGYALSGDDRLRAEIIERIMCDFGVDLDPICARHGLSASSMLRSNASTAMRPGCSTAPAPSTARTVSSAVGADPTVPR